ncbi:hypothetical protein BDZ97DRAFT_2026365 [Flammula alnicola]|nr:hypothetical protein BDZ97DRAFT_2026365 [Flammula alnicola]
MLTLTPGCACDVCAEEYGPHRLPHSIPCGHVLCASCIQTIVEKTSARLSPVCPFCREQFTSDSSRLIRMDFTTSGWSTPRRFPAMETFNDFNSEVLQRKTAHLFNSSHDHSKTRIEVRRLEDKVARVAAKKCSVEEVSSLYKELEEWLLAEKDDQTSSLFLSAALLRAILMNHLAHSESSKAAKTAEHNLKNKIEDLEINNTKIEAELRRQRSQYTQKSQECQQLRTEVNQLRALATTLGVSPPDVPAAPATSPTPSPSPAHIAAAAAAASPLARFNSMHVRSASMSSRPTTPAIAAAAAHASMPRAHTPAPTPPRSHTPGPMRAQTPAVRSYTPAPPVPPTPSALGIPPVPPVPSLPMRYSTPAPFPGYSRAQTPAPLVPPKPRRLSLSSTTPSTTPSPPRMVARSTSEEKAEAHERWIPPLMGRGRGRGGLWMIMSIVVVVQGRGGIGERQVWGMCARRRGRGILRLGWGFEGAFFFRPLASALHWTLFFFFVAFRRFSSRSLFLVHHPIPYHPILYPSPTVIYPPTNNPTIRYGRHTHTPTTTPQRPRHDPTHARYMHDSRSHDSENPKNPKIWL